MKKLIWVGDACVATGFAKATHNILDNLHYTWDIDVLGMHYTGDPYFGGVRIADYPYRIWPTRRPGMNPDFLGARRLPELCAQLEPDVVVVQNDVWNVPHYVRELRNAGISVPIVAAVAVDGKNVRAKQLDDVKHVIFWTKFAQDEAIAGGYAGPSTVIPLGVDLEVYKLHDFAHVEQLRTHARTLLEKTEGSKLDLAAASKSFIVLNVNRNQRRKRLDLTIEYFCEWVKREGIQDAFLMVQAAPTGEEEYDIEQLMAYYGLGHRLIYYMPDKATGIPEASLVWTYRCADVGLTTTQGEGFGLTTFEMMALGIPQIVPAWSALNEICEEAALKIPCTSHAATTFTNTIGGIADKEQTIHTLNLLYQRKELREELGRRGLDVVRQERYRWASIAEQYDNVLTSIVSRKKVVDDLWADVKPQEVVGAS